MIIVGVVWRQVYRRRRYSEVGTKEVGGYHCSTRTISNDKLADCSLLRYIDHSELSLKLESTDDSSDLETKLYFVSSYYLRGFDKGKKLTLEGEVQVLSIRTAAGSYIKPYTRHWDRYVADFNRYMKELFN